MKFKSEYLLFVHNSLPEYRIQFWKELDKYIKVDLWITNQNLENKIYGLEKDVSKLNIIKKNIFQVRKQINKYDRVILPPIDGVHEYIISKILVNQCVKYEIPFYYWTEKWEPEVQFQPIWKRIKNQIQKKMIKIVAKNATACIASGSKAKEYFISMDIKDNKINIAFDSSTSPQKNIEDIRNKYGVPKNKKIILFMGRIIKRKGCHLLIEACKDILESNNAMLLIGGDGEYKKECEKLAKGFPIKFIGKVQPFERRNLYNESLVFVLPSYFYKGVCEAWGLTVNESMECGTPVIATTAVGASYDLINNDTGILVKQNNIDELRRAILDIISEEKVFNKDKIINMYKSKSINEMAKSFYNIIK